MDDHIEEKLKNLEEWKNERARVKPFIDIAVDYHNKARTEARWKNYEQAAHFYKEAIKNYKNAVSQGPRYYLQDLLDRIDHVIGEHINNTFNLKTSGYRLKNETDIHEFIDFVDNLDREQREYISRYDIAQAYLRIGDFYCDEKNLRTAYEFYNRVIDIHCDRPFINHEVYFKIGMIQITEERFKEALVSFVSVLSFDRSDREAMDYLEHCLKKLGIEGYKNKFLTATPDGAKKLIMEIL